MIVLGQGRPDYPQGSRSRRKLSANPSKGGPVCQYETNINTYLDTAKNIYKDLVAIKQNINGEKEIRSRVFQIEMSRDGDAYVPGGKIKERFILPRTFCAILASACSYFESF